MDATVRIPLTKGYEAIINAADLALVSRYKWCASESKDGRRVYAVTCALGLIKPGRRLASMHELIAGRSYVDHHDGNTLNNRRKNLRPCTVTQNLGNAQKWVGRSKYKGVSPHKDRWRAAIACKGKRYHLGRFLNEEDAARAYDAAAIELFGEFARPNFPRKESV